MPEQPSITINNNSNQFWIALCIVMFVVGAILFSKGCHKDVQYAQEKAKADSFQMQNDKLKYDHVLDSIEKNKLIGHIHNELTGTQIQKDSIWMAFSKLQKQYYGLSGRILTASVVKQDTNSWVVPSSYKNMCDSCATALQQGSRELDSLRKEDTLVKALYDNEIKLRMAYEGDLSKQFDSCMSIGAAQSNLITKMAKDLQPRNKLYGGAEANVSHSYSSVGLWLQLETKNNKSFGIEGGLNTLNSYYVGFRAGIKIF